MTKKILEKVVIFFAGDSGDGIQLTGSQFTNTTALYGNDLSTFPDFPAEIRAPQGTLAGVSGFQISFGSTEIFTPGDECDVLVVMNVAALKANRLNIALFLLYMHLYYKSQGWSGMNHQGQWQTQLAWIKQANYFH